MCCVFTGNASNNSNTSSNNDDCDMMMRVVLVMMVKLNDGDGIPGWGEKNVLTLNKEWLNFFKYYFCFAIFVKTVVIYSIKRIKINKF